MFSQTAGQGWSQAALLGVAFVLCGLIGLERELRQKSAGLRTHTLVGLASALMTLVSKFGFGDVIEGQVVMLDPSRVASQIVSGIGFIGAGLIFVRRDAVRGLTTAASIWMVAAVGMAAGAGLPVLAGLVTAGHFAVVFGFTALSRRLPRSRFAISALQVDYADGRGVLRRVLSTCTGRGFAVTEVSVVRAAEGVEVSVLLHVQGLASVAGLSAELAELDGVHAVNARDANDPLD